MKQHLNSIILEGDVISEPKVKNKKMEMDILHKEKNGKELIYTVVISDTINKETIPFLKKGKTIRAVGEITMIDYVKIIAVDIEIFHTTK
jgi:hypothetical protein